MIDTKDAKRYCKSYTEVENYEAAVSDTTQTWHCHHRLEIAPFSGERVPMKFLIKQGLYYNQPPEALIFLTSAEHVRLHHKGRKRRAFSEETRRKLSEANKGRKLGPHSEESNRKRSETVKTLKWFNNGIKNIRTKECPVGFVSGRIKAKYSKSK